MTRCDIFAERLAAKDSSEKSMTMHESIQDETRSQIVMSNNRAHVSS
jgi:hypothetical protein